MDRLNQLRAEYEDNAKKMRYPFSVSDYIELKERRAAILEEARTLATNVQLFRDFI